MENMAGKIHFCLFNVKKKKKFEKKIETHRWVIFLPFTYHFAERLILRHLKFSMWCHRCGQRKHLQCNLSCSFLQSCLN